MSDTSIRPTELRQTQAADGMAGFRFAAELISSTRPPPARPSRAAFRVFAMLNRDCLNRAGRKPNPKLRIFL